MIVTEKFVFLHLHKTAGTSFNSFITDNFPKFEWIGYHLPLRVLPAKWGHLPVLGLVRNPWEFYVSWYSFQMQKERANPLFSVVSKNRTLDFNSTIRRLLTLCEDEQLLSSVVTHLPNTFGNSGMNVPASAMASILGSKFGLYSFLYHWMYTPIASNLTILRTDQLQNELKVFFDRIEVNFTREMQERLASSAPKNTSRHQHYPEHYDADVADLVRQLDDSVISRHGYGFESRE